MDETKIPDNIIKTFTEELVKTYLQDYINDYVNEYIRENFAKIVFQSLNGNNEGTGMLKFLSEIKMVKESKHRNLFDVHSSKDNVLADFLQDFGKSSVEKSNANSMSTTKTTQKIEQTSSDGRVQKIDFGQYRLKNKLKNVLNDYDLSQQELADFIEISRGTVTSIINNKGVSLENAFKISQLLGLSIYDIFQYERINTDV